MVWNRGVGRGCDCSGDFAYGEFSMWCASLRSVWAASGLLSLRILGRRGFRSGELIMRSGLLFFRIVGLADVSCCVVGFQWGCVSHSGA